jgi:Domain of unknown function (DUF4349)
MRRPEDMPLDPEIVTTLEAIDATLAGEAVDPRHAELAELALLLASDRPVIEESFARLLDEQVSKRAAPAPTKPRRKSPRRRAQWWVWAPTGAVAASLVAAVVIVLGEGGGGSSGPPIFGAPSAVGTTASATGVRSAAPKEKLLAKPAPRTLAQKLVPAPTVAGASAHHHASPNGGGASASGTSSSASFATPPATLSPGAVYAPLSLPTAGRKVIQSSQLLLSTSPKRVEQVSNEVYAVVGQEKGIVKSSNVTSNGGHGGYAQFLLSVPSSNLARTMADLSNLPYAKVASRTDSSQDVTNTYRFEQQRLQDAQALRTSLLKQLATAYTTAQIDSLQARIHIAEAQIASDENALHSLQRSVSYSQINVAINSNGIPVPAHSGGGFTLSRAAHDAGRVLTVAAGVALIVLAAMLPVGLLLALLWWIWRTARRRSRQQALDLA